MSAINACQNKKSQSQQAAGYSISLDFLILTGQHSVIASYGVLDPVKK